MKEEESYTETIPSNDAQEIKDNYSYDFSLYINNDAWKDFTRNIVINDNVETLCIHYKGIKYKFNLEKVLNILADVVEDTAIVNK